MILDEIGSGNDCPCICCCYRWVIVGSRSGWGVLRSLVLSWIIVVHCLDAAIEEEEDKWAGSL